MTRVTSTTFYLSGESQRQLAGICASNGITWLAMFGSLARGEARPDSDVDLLVEFQPDTRLSYLDLERIAQQLSPLFGGRWVDIGHPKQLHWYIRDRVIAEARVLYEG